MKHSSILAVLGTLVHSNPSPTRSRINKHLDRLSLTSESQLCFKVQLVVERGGWLLENVFYAQLGQILVFYGLVGLG